MLDPYNHWLANMIVAGATLLIVILVVLVHYEGLNVLNQRLTRLSKTDRRHDHRRMVLYSIISVILLHIVEIWIFGLGYHGLMQLQNTGRVLGAHHQLLFDHVYFSAAVYTTVGFGDLSPTGPIRFMAGTEALIGFVLVGWSASFTYLEMQRYWQLQDQAGEE